MAGSNNGMELALTRSVDMLHEIYQLADQQGSIFPTPNVCEFETRPGSTGHGCANSELDALEGLCQPSLEPRGQNPGPSSASKNQT